VAQLKHLAAVTVCTRRGRRGPVTSMGSLGRGPLRSSRGGCRPAHPGPSPYSRAVCTCGRRPLRVCYSFTPTAQADLCRITIPAIPARIDDRVRLDQTGANATNAKNAGGFLESPSLDPNLEPGRNTAKSICTTNSSKVPRKFGEFQCVAQTRNCPLVGLPGRPEDSVAHQLLISRHEVRPAIMAELDVNDAGLVVGPDVHHGLVIQ